jgi:predicted ATPase/DNA-binding SARP family transcriptional activator
MRFEVLGPLRVTVGDNGLALGSPQQQKVLALLLASPNQVVSTDRLVDEVWGDVSPPSARHLVQDYVWRLRRLLDKAEAGPRIDRKGSGYMIAVSPEELDALQLAAAVDEAGELLGRDVAAAEQLLREATGMWRGPPFGDLSDESPSLQAEAARLKELHLTAVEKYIDAEIEAGRHGDLVGQLEGLTGQHPYRERFWGRLMLVLYRSGRQAEALRAYRTLRKTLGEELGIEPGPSIRELERQILLHDPNLLWEPPHPPSNLPTRLTSFIGRTEEIAEVAKLLDTSRLVTLTGPGGIGKTRLATEVADRTLFHYPDGVWWVDLAAVTDPDMVVAGLANALGVTAQAETPLLDSLIHSLGHRVVLLVVDNCEHLATTTAEVIGQVLREAEGVRVLATSRVPLRVSGEVLWAVPALSTPLTSGLDMADVRLADAVNLFVERATTVERTFALSDGNVDAVVEICRRLDGIPLAIEMAAARARVLTPAQISASLDDRFSVLTRGESDPDPRHATLQAALDWSYDLLDPELQRIFDRLAVFAGAFDLQAAGAVALHEGDSSPVLDAISHLVDASILTTVGGQPQRRYRLLETLREYGMRHLTARGDEDNARESHADYFLGLAEQAGAEIVTPGFTSWISRLQGSYDDLQAALAWSMARHSRARTLRVAPTMYHLWFRTGNAREVDRWSKPMLEDAEQVPAPLLAAAHLCAAFGATIRGDQEESEAQVGEALRLYRESGDRRGTVTALFGRGSIALRIGDFDTVAKCSEEALALCDEIGDRWGKAGHLANLGFVHFMGGGSLDEARRLAEEALVLYRELGDIGSQVVMIPLSAIALKQGDLQAAERFAMDTAAIGAGTGWEATALVNLAEVLIAKGDVDGAEATLKRGVVRALDTGLENWFRIALRDLSRIAVLNDDPRRAALLLGASRRNIPHYGLDPVIYESVETECRRWLDEDTLSRGMEDGYNMGHEQLLLLAEGS